MNVECYCSCYCFSYWWTVVSEVATVVVVIIGMDAAIAVVSAEGLIIMHFLLYGYRYL